MAREKKYFGKEEVHGTVTYIRCEGCNNLVKPKSIYSHLNSDEHKARSAIKEASDKGHVVLGAFQYSALSPDEILPEGNPLCPFQKSPTHFKRGGWGSPNRISYNWTAPAYVQHLTQMLLFAEPVGYTPAPSRIARYKIWCEKLFATEENIQLARALASQLAPSVETDGKWAGVEAHRGAVIWAAQLVALLDLPPLLDSETAQKLDAEFEAIKSAEREKTWKAEQAEREAERAREEAEKRKQEKMLEYSRDLYGACEAVLEQVTEDRHDQLRAAIRNLLRKVNEIDAPEQGE